MKFRNLFVGSLAGIALFVACGSEETDNSTVVTQPETLVPPTIVRFNDLESTFWTLRGFGELREVPERISGSSSPLEVDVLLESWSEFFSDTLLVDSNTLVPWVHLCEGGEVRWPVDGTPRSAQGDRIGSVGTGDFIWQVEELDATSGIEESLQGGNSVSVALRSGFSVVREFLGGADGIVVAVATGAHIGLAETEVPERGVGSAFVATESRECA